MSRLIACWCLLTLLGVVALAGAQGPPPPPPAPGQPAPAPDDIAATGVVLQPDGQPSPGARVTCTACGYPGQALAGPDGRFAMRVPRITGPADRRWVFVAVNAAGDLCAGAIADPARGPVTLRLERAGWLTTEVVDPQGRPVPGVRVECLTRDVDYYATLASVVSDATGLVRVGPVPCGMPLRLQVTEADADYVLSPEWDPDNWRESVAYTLSPGERRTWPQLVFSPEGRSLEVFVGDAAGKPVAGAEVYAPGRQGFVTTDEKGRVRLRHLPVRGKVTVVAAHPTLPHFAAASTDPDLGYWPGLLLQPLVQATGVLADRDGKALAGVGVTVLPDNSLPRDEGLRARLGFTAETFWGRAATGANGEWTAGGLVDGLSYNLMMWARWGRDDREGMCVAGRFVARTAADVQQVGTISCRFWPRR